MRQSVRSFLVVATLAVAFVRVAERRIGRP